MKKRLDQKLLELSLCENLSKAQAYILAGEIWVNGHPQTSADFLVQENDQVERRHAKYVSRGGDKLESALIHFQVSPQDQIILDMGASTGGFTDCLLQHQAKFVIAADVGQGLIDWKLRTHPQVFVAEKINARLLNAEQVQAWPHGKEITWVVMDISFISILKVIPALIQSLNKNFQLLSLIKPQFEAARDEVGPGGIIRDTHIHQKVLASIEKQLLDWNFENIKFCPSGTLGSKGNQEFFTLAQYHA